MPRGRQFQRARTQIAFHFRRGIMKQVVAWKRYPPAERECAFCKSAIFLEVDHLPRFSDLLTEFLATNGFPQEMFDRDDPVLYTAKPYMLKESFAKFHLEKARYRFLCSDCHRTINSSGKNIEIPVDEWMMKHKLRGELTEPAGLALTNPTAPS